MKVIYFLVFFFISLGSSGGEEIFDGPWQEVKGTHFVVRYSAPADASEAGRILRRAEEYYTKIANQIGYARYTNFWTWEDRAKIYIFATQEEFVKQTSQPAWSRGYVVSDIKLFDSRMIVTYRQEESFSQGLLPHEISHLILKDFIGFDVPIPIWFDEGVAQLQETDKKDLAYQIMKNLIAREKHIPLVVLNQINIHKEKETQKVSNFYAQSLTVIEFF